MQFRRCIAELETIAEADKNRTVAVVVVNFCDDSSLTGIRRAGSSPDEHPVAYCGLVRC